MDEEGPKIGKVEHGKTQENSRNRMIHVWDEADVFKSIDDF